MASRWSRDLSGGREGGEDRGEGQKKNGQSKTNKKGGEERKETLD